MHIRNVRETVSWCAKALLTDKGRDVHMLSHSLLLPWHSLLPQLHNLVLQHTALKLRRNLPSLLLSNFEVISGQCKHSKYILLQKEIYRSTSKGNCQSILSTECPALLSAPYYMYSSMKFHFTKSAYGVASLT